MAVLAGNAGSFKISSNTVAELDTWTLDVSTGLEETQSFGDTWKERTVDGTNYYSGTAFVQAALNASENGLVTVSYTFTGSGALSFT